jgi:hypothetical protein
MRTTCWAVLLCGLVATGVRADDAAEAKKLVDRAVKALGGEEALAKAAGYTFQVDGKIEAGAEVDVKGDWSVQGLDRYRWNLQATVMGRTQEITLVFVGEKGWVTNPADGRTNDIPKELTPVVLNVFRLARLAQNPLALRDKAFTLSHLGELKINDRDMVGLKIQRKGAPEVDLFLDKKSALPCKAELRQKEGPGGEEVSHTFYFDDYKDAGPVKHFGKVRFERDGKSLVELAVSEVKAEEKINDDVFARPEKK